MPIDATRVYHANSNCTDLGRSLEFYRDLVGLTTLTRTAPPEPQPGGAFGLEQAQWDAWIMAGDHSMDGVVLDLLEWKIPAPTGRPPQSISQLGLHRLCFTTPELDVLHRRMSGADVDVWSEPAPDSSVDGSRRTFFCADPDGTPLQFAEGEDTTIDHVVVNCTDLDVSTRFYVEVMGLTAVGETRTAPPSSAGDHADPTSTATFQRLEDPNGFGIELAMWSSADAGGSGRRRANDLGLFRLAWFTHDIEAAYRDLVDGGHRCYSPPVALQMGPGLPDDLLALFFEDPDGACLELIASPAD